jgi:hypothetical protein
LAGVGKYEFKAKGVQSGLQESDKEGGEDGIQVVADALLFQLCECKQRWKQETTCSWKSAEDSGEYLNV